MLKNWDDFETAARELERKHERAILAQINRDRTLHPRAKLKLVRFFFLVVAVGLVLYALAVRYL